MVSNHGGFLLSRLPFGDRQLPCFRTYRSFLSSGFGAAGRGLQYFTIADKEQPFDLAILPIASIEHLCYNYYVEKTDFAFEKNNKKRQCIGTAIPIHLRRWRYHLHNGLRPHRKNQYTFFFERKQEEPCGLR